MEGDRRCSAAPRHPSRPNAVAGLRHGALSKGFAARVAGRPEAASRVCMYPTRSGCPWRHACIEKKRRVRFAYTGYAPFAVGRCSRLCFPRQAGNASTLRCNACCPEVKEEASSSAGAGDGAGGHGGRQALQRGASPCLRTSAVAAVRYVDGAGSMEGDRHCIAAPRHPSGHALLQRVRHAACSKRSAAAQQALRRRAPPCIRDTPPPSPPRCAPLTRATCAAYCPPPPVTDGTSGPDRGFPRVFTCYGLAPLQPIRDQQPCCRRGDPWD